MFAFAIKNWRAIAIAGFVLAVLAYHWNAVRVARNEGREAVKIEQQREAAKRNGDANAAQEASDRCQRNPACRLSDDGHRRD